jgi:hypothetical protein
MQDGARELNKAAQDIAKYFYEKTGRHITKGTYVQQISCAKNLINAGFSSDDIIKGIDWLIANPPRNGFSSLGYLSYVLDDILIVIKANEIKQSIIQDYNQYIDLCKNEQFSNVEKFQQQSKPKVKGS